MNIINTNYVVKNNNFERQPKSINFGSSRIKNINTKFLSKIFSAAAASLGIATISLSQINNGKKLSLKNDEIISLLNACKEDKNGYDLQKLIETYEAIMKTNPEDEQGKVIIPLLRSFGDPNDWVKKYPKFSEYLSESIINNTYEDDSVRNKIKDSLSKNYIKSSNIELYEKYLEDGYILENDSFLELYEKSCYLSELPYKSKNFENYSLKTKNALVKEIESLYVNKLSDAEIEDYAGMFYICPEELVYKTLNKIHKIKKLTGGFECKIEAELSKCFGQLLQEKNNKKEQEIIKKHMFSLAILSIFDSQNYEEIINCPFYTQIIKDKKYLPLLESFDFNTPYNMKDFRKKVNEFEENKRDKFKNYDCDLLKDLDKVKISLSKLDFNEDEVKEIVEHINNSKDKELMEKILKESTLLIDSFKKKDAIYLIKNISTNPDKIKFLQEKTSSIFEINSALKIGEKYGYDAVNKIMDSSIAGYTPITILNSINDNNINFVLDYIDNAKDYNEQEFEKILTLKKFKNLNNKDLKSILEEIDIILKETGMIFIPEVINILNLKESSPEVYENIKNSGYFEFFLSKEAIKYFNKNTDLNKNIYEDLERFKNNESIIKEFDKNTTLDEAFAQSECGDVVSIAEKLYINDGNQLIAWQMSRERFLDLFPLGTRFATRQANGNCYLISSFVSIMQNPKARVMLYQLFKEDGNDLYVTIKGYEEYKGVIKVDYGKIPWSEPNNHLKGCKALQLLEWAYAKTAFIDGGGSKRVFVTEDTKDYDLMRRTDGGQSHTAIGELLGLKYKSVDKIPAKFSKTSLSLDIKDNSSIKDKDFEDIMEKYANDDNYILNFSTPPGIAKNDYNITERHGHSIVGYDKANKVVLVENPHNSAIVNKVPLKVLYPLVQDLFITNLN